MWPYMMGGFGWGGWFMPILLIAFWGLVLWGIIALVRYTLYHNARHSDSPLETLKLRYSRGEVTKAEYEEKKKELV
jgi:putative membrane protein